MSDGVVIASNSCYDTVYGIIPYDDLIKRLGQRMYDELEGSKCDHIYGYRPETEVGITREQSKRKLRT